MRIFYADARTSSYISQTDVRSALHISNLNLNLRLGLISAASPICAEQRQRQAKRALNTGAGNCSAPVQGSDDRCNSMIAETGR